MTGKFIVFEGTDGAGKSAMITATKEHLKSKGVKALYVQDPGGTNIGSALRTVLLNPEFTKMTPMTELLLYSASRNQLVNELIRPALDRGEIVISDRFIYSTLAYQGASGKINEETLQSITEAGADGLKPDNVIYLDLPAEVGLSRISGKKDRIEEKGIQYMKEVRTRYHEALAKIPVSRLCIINAEKPIEQVKIEVLESLDELL